MAFTRWLRNLKSICPLGMTAASSRSAVHSRPAARYRPRLEVLEDRTVPSTFHVTTMLDGVGVPGSLRQAILDANTQAGADVIDFAPDVRGTLMLTDGQLSIMGDLTINGPGTEELAVSGKDTSRVFQIGTGVTATIDRLSITHGLAVQQGGGILNLGTLTLSQVILSDNQAVAGPGARGEGGGIMNRGALTVTQCAFLHNQSFGGAATAGRGGNATGGALASNGGIASPPATVRVSQCTFSDNRATAGAGGSGAAGGDAAGGAIFTDNGTLFLTNSTLTHNWAIAGAGGAGGAGGGGRGGAIAERAGAGNATLTVSYSTLSDNQAIGGVAGDGGTGGTGTGGGISARLEGAGLTSLVTISHSAVSGNLASGGVGASGGIGQGGGIANDGGGTFIVGYSTLCGNEALGGSGSNAGSGGTGRGGGLFVSSGTVAIERSAITDNQATGGTGGTEGQGVGGGIHVAAGTVTVKKTKFWGNHASTSHDDVFGDLIYDD